MPHPAPSSLGLLLVSIHHLFLDLMIFQQPRGDGSFSKEVLHSKGQELVSALDKRTGKKMSSTRI